MEKVEAVVHQSLLTRRADIEDNMSDHAIEAHIYFGQN